MNKKILLGVIVVTFAMLSGTAFATPNWDIKGTWTWNYYYGGGTYTHTMIIDTFDTVTGDFSGHGFYNPNPSYTWDIIGTVDGDNIDFYIDYTGLNPSYYIDATGTIDSSTQMSGDATAPGQVATWDATGEAHPPDSDNDGIPDTEDMCSGTSVDVPSVRLGVNRWIWDGEEEGWITNEPNGEGPQKEFTMEDTRGCSCEQILETMGGKMTGHSKFGCSIGVMENFIASMQPVFVETVEVYANNPNPTYSDIALESGVQYELEAMGTAYAGGKYTEDIEFDAKYSITHSKVTDDWTDTVTDYESYGTTLLDLFVNGGSVDWGIYNPEHTYYWTETGAGAALELLIYDIYYPNNVGSLTVNIYELP